jgi:hypothetical protein
MLKKIIILLAIAGCFSCSMRKPDMLPPSNPFFCSLSIKFNIHDGKVRQNGRVLWRFDDEHAKFLFFSPLNQVGLELDVDSEEAVLVNFAKKTFWRGAFIQLLERMWGIGITLSELKTLMVKGEIPRSSFSEKGIAVSLEYDKKSGSLETVRLKRADTELALRIQKNEFRPGKIVLINYAERYQDVDLETLLTDD